MRIVLIDDEPMFRAGFRVALAEERDLELVGEARDARSGFRAIDNGRPDVVVIDVVLPGMDGFSATREIKRRSPSTRVLILTGRRCERDLVDALGAGALGLAVKTDSTEEILGAIRAVGAGRRYFPLGLRTGVVNSAVEGVENGRFLEGDTMLAGLSEREQEVLWLVLKGHKNREVASELCISIKTVDTHRSHINRKLACRNTADLIRFAARNGLFHYLTDARLGERATPIQKSS